MKISTISLEAFLILALATFLLSGCSGCSSTGKDTEMESLSLLVEKYHQKDLPGYKDSDRFSAYFDFSDGMLFAYKENATKEILESITNKLTGASANCDVFSLASNKVEKLTLHQTALYNKIMDPTSYNNVLNAPIEKALKKIIEDNRSALLVTDFEEYTTDGKIQYQNFAKDYFIDWLKKGNDITFFVTDYLEKSQSKHLYYIVLDNPNHRLLGKINEKNGEELCRYALNEKFASETAVVAGSLVSDEEGEWSFEAIGKGYEGGLNTLIDIYA